MPRHFLLIDVSQVDSILTRILELRMSQGLSIYSSRSAITGQKLFDAGAKSGLQLRYLAMGATIPFDPDKFLRSLKQAGSGAMFVVGAAECQAEAVGRLDGLIEQHDRAGLAKLLKSDDLPWVEVLTNQFDYTTHIQKFPQDEARFAETYDPETLSQVQTARMWYVVDNQSRSKAGAALMRSLADLIAHVSKGIVAPHLKPKR